MLFDKPSYLLLLLLLIPLGYLYYLWPSRGGRVVISYKIYKDKQAIARQYGIFFLAGVSQIFLFATFILLIIALANPTFIERHRILLHESSAIMIVMDVSPSMAAQDSGQNDSRFDIAREAILRFIAQRENTPIGLITFGLEAAVRIPLTKDYPFFAQRLDDVWLMEHGDGTNIGMALSLAALQLQRSKAEHKTIILITDGANNVEDINTDDAIALLQSLNIQAFTVGVGSQERLPISVWDKKNEQLLQGVVSDAYDEELMRAIAVQTGGYFFKSESASAFDSMFTVVEQQREQEGIHRISVTAYSTQFDLIFIAFMALWGFIIIRYLLLREVF
ncbi:VWA domain-containing protein [Entomospira culicis]|nr:VWA domain-containing protein [Entomospira culicis]WDI37954.1 VWA domain-containing protein [Entomospira culicis]WDI39579.1 VWA domain-containing protein [Entomospira culicis]